MNAIGGKVRALQTKQIGSERFPARLNSYSSCAVPEISLEQFENYALDRLRVLKAIETAKARNKKEDEFRAYMKQIEEKYLPLHSNSSKVNIDDEREKDVISHFILKLAYSRTEDLRRWFVNQEVALFRHRYEQESTEDIEIFLKEGNFNLVPISKEEKDLLSRDLAQAGNLPSKELQNLDFYKVPFEQALDLLTNRKVYMKKGFAYVSSADLLSLLAAQFRVNLNRSLALTARALPKMEEDERLLPILENMAKQHALNSEYENSTKKTGDVSAEDVSKLTQHMPLCMKHLHAKLNEDHHLRHGGRMQYGLFLKSIGLSLEEALIFWRKAFQPRTPEDKFNKTYAYNLRHNYGQEGKRTSYSPYSCMKIITNHPSAMDHHGCPFRHFSPDNLRATLRQQKVLEPNIHEILELIKNQHFQVACTRFFEITHSIKSGQMDVIQHPNIYFDLSIGKKQPNKESNKENKGIPNTETKEQGEIKENSQQESSGGESSKEKKIEDDKVVQMDEEDIQKELEMEMELQREKEIQDKEIEAMIESN